VQPNQVFFEAQLILNRGSNKIEEKIEVASRVFNSNYGKMNNKSKVILDWLTGTLIRSADSKKVTDNKKFKY
jgi:hypothetical protein